MEVYCCCIVQRTVAAVPVIRRYHTTREKGLFGLELGIGKDMQMVKIEKNEKVKNQSPKFI